MFDKHGKLDFTRKMILLTINHNMEWEAGINISTSLEL